MKIRPAVTEDANEISAFLGELAALGKRTLPFDPDFVRNHYVNHPENIQCSVAESDQGEILGLQVLKRASPTNPYGVTAGWGIIGTHVKPSAAGRGVGRALFATTQDIAKDAGLAEIDATIGANNPEALGYYEAMGFRTYRSSGGKISKCYRVS